MKFISGLIFFVLSVILQYIWIKIQRRIHLTQQQKTYGVNIDNEIKAATPSMGGVVFLVLGLILLALNFSLNSLIFWSLPILSGVIGLIDDWIKFITHTSEGFRSLAKLRVQLLICAVWIIIIFLKGDLELWPGLPYLWRIIAIPLAFLMTAGTINAVNITDGLDGLAAGSFIISLAVLFEHYVFCYVALLMVLEMENEMEFLKMLEDQ